MPGEASDLGVIVAQTDVTSVCRGRSEQCFSYF